MLEEIRTPTDRTIIWVAGKSYGKGKTWLQNYDKDKWGYRRVVTGISLHTKRGHIAHSLMKHPLDTADIFNVEKV